MPRVIVTQPSVINVRVGQQNQPKVVTGTTTFIGAADVQDQVNHIQQMAQYAMDTSNNAVILVDTKYDKTGGPITGDVNISNNLTVGNTIFADVEIVDAGTF